MIDLSNLPQSPGIYIYKNSAGEIIYVGKAINLKKRVSQYWQRDDALGPKTRSLVFQIADISVKIVASEIEALILEATYIKKYRPKFNSLLKDDKSYIYISISRDKYPLVTRAFKSGLNPKSENYGPFPSGTAVTTLLKTFRRLFPYYQKSHSSKPCLYCHLGLCPGPDISVSDYLRNIRNIKRILRGHFKSLLSGLNRDMKIASKSEDFEKAATFRDQINSLTYITSGWQNLSHLYSQINLPEDEASKAESELISVLQNHLHLSAINRIEAFDISNFGRNYFVGSMVVYQNGQIDHSQYRQFKIYSKTTPDDQLMIKEVVWRRLKHHEWPYPDIILVDGGKPQVTAAAFALQEHKNIFLIGLAKRLETIVIKTGNRAGLPSEWREINLPQNSPSLRLLQRLRDEAHRFANRYRIALMKKSLHP
ncbi:MAG: GIY-YIG nuclease family protein [Candidatus Shapirobacteria bacterium]